MSNSELAELLGLAVALFVVGMLLTALMLHGAAVLLDSLTYLFRLARLGWIRHRRNRHTLTGKTNRTVAL